MNAELQDALLRLREHGYMPMYNGRPSCPFCHNFVDEEETHNPGCVLLAVEFDDALDHYALRAGTTD